MGTKVQNRIDMMQRWMLVESLQRAFCPTLLKDLRSVLLRRRTYLRCGWHVERELAQPVGKRSEVNQNAILLSSEEFKDKKRS